MISGPGGPGFSLEESYDAFPRIEAEFGTALDASLGPRGPDLLYELVRDLQLGPHATVVDVGCGEGRHSVALAERFGFSVHGVDPVARPRHGWRRASPPAVSASIAGPTSGATGRSSTKSKWAVRRGSCSTPHVCSRIRIDT